MTQNRRQFVKTLGTFSAIPAAYSGPALAARSRRSFTRYKGLGFKKKIADELEIASGFSAEILAKTGDVVNAAGDTFGDCCDFTHFVAGKNSNHGFLWVNHEYFIDRVVYGRKVLPQEKTKAMADAETTLVGGSYLEIKRKNSRAHWEIVANSKDSFRLNAETSIPMVGPAGGRNARGTLANCGGGHTPWGSILTCEENFDMFVDPTHEDYNGWQAHHNRNPEDYGWVVEIDPKTKAARKLTSLGRFEHEGACVSKTKSGFLVVYMGDDKKFEHLYKFVSKNKVTGSIAKNKDLLLDGTLYAADLGNARWIPLTLDHPNLKGQFKDQADLLINTRKAAKLVNATPLNRPEDIEVNIRTGTVLVALTNNKKAGDYFGSILAINERNGDGSATNFTFQTYLTGGPDLGFACPDNLCFGPKNSFWVATDISGKKLGKGAYQHFSHNGLYRIERRRGQIEAHCLVKSPNEAEVTGPCFTPDGKSLFLSIQHPGEESFKKVEKYTSNWPGKTGDKPSSAVVSIIAGKKRVT